MFRIIIKKKEKRKTKIPWKKSINLKKRDKSNKKHRDGIRTGEMQNKRYNMS